MREGARGGGGAGEGSVVCAVKLGFCFIFC